MSALDENCYIGEVPSHLRCRTKDCKREAGSTGWCEKCLDELSEHIEQHPLGCVPTRGSIDEVRIYNRNASLQIIISSNEKGHGSELDIDGAKFGPVLVGDIIAEGKDCVIERKDINDFLGSSCSDHMWKQAKDMRENYKRQVVIIEGHFPDDASYRNKKLIPQGYKAIAALIRQGITVLNVKNAAMLSTLSMAILKEAEPRDPTIPIKKVEKDGKHSVIQAIEGVGQQKAKALIEKYGSVAKLSMVPLQELSEFKVNGRKIGEKVAKHIKETLN